MGVATLADMIDEVVAALACPHCGQSLALGERQLSCSAGHSFDLARQGYAHLVGGGGTKTAGDTATMIAARERVHERGLLGQLVTLVADTAAAALAHAPAGIIADVGAGPGHYLAACLDRVPSRAGVAVDVSKHALRRAARCHPRAGAVGADAWHGLPLRDDAVALALSVFAPRDADELARVLAPSGALVIARPGPAHLRELVEPLGLVGIDSSKEQRLDAALGGAFERVDDVAWHASLGLQRDDAIALLEMGPCAFHAPAEGLVGQLADWSFPLETTADVRVSVRRLRGAPHE